MNDHSHYEELTALAAGGFLSDEESRELREHLAACAECRRVASEFRDLVRLGLPMARSQRLGFVDRVRARPDAGARKRFLERAKREGIRFSSGVEKATSPARSRVGYRLAGAAALAGVILVAAFYGVDTRRRAQHEVERLKGENSTLGARLAEQDRLVAKQEGQIQNLSSQIEDVARTANSHRQEIQGARAEKSNSQNVQLLDELQNRDKQLSEAKDEIARINQLHQTDEASVAMQQIRIKEISDQLRIASATLDVERQLAAAGRDIRELMVSRQLHVVDVRDTDADGKPSRTFGRVFLTEGKSLVFYAFDLSDAKSADSKTHFQVWGEQAGKPNSAHSLGLFYVDNDAQKRWALKVDNPELLNEINSVFVTVVRPGGSNKPSGQRLLYAYLGEPNHP